MKILVCITHVPDTTTKIVFNDNFTQLNTAQVQFIIGPYDEYALARAVEIKEQQGADITVLNVGEAETEPTLRKALAIGADDAIRINLSPKDSFETAFQIAEMAKKGAYDLILMGRESIDFNGGVVHGMVGELLGWPSINPVMKLDIAQGKALMVREIEGGKETMEATLPLVLGCQEPIAEWKIPNMRGIMSARTKPLTVVEPFATILQTSNHHFESPAPRSGCKMIDPAHPEQLLVLLRSEAKVL